MKKLVDGEYVNLTQQEIEMVSAEETSSLPDLVRSRRDSLLAQSDVYALADRITPEWASYRQALRDITAQEGFPYSVIWPVKP
jgi:hypothetical protein